MIIRAKYENGVFKPLEDVTLAEGTLVKISVPVEASPQAAEVRARLAGLRHVGRPRRHH
jgi:predicted DNA-binding antitoxin AbrB/MazE fold protein